MAIALPFIWVAKSFMFADDSVGFHILINDYSWFLRMGSHCQSVSSIVDLNSAMGGHLAGYLVIGKISFGNSLTKKRNYTATYRTIMPVNLARPPDESVGPGGGARGRETMWGRGKAQILRLLGSNMTGNSRY